MHKLSLFLLPAVVLLSGCASMIRSNIQEVQIKAIPNNVDFKVTDSQGKTVFTGKTPAQIKLQPSFGNYKGPEKYKVIASKPGYITETYEIGHHVSRWHYASIFLAGMVGGLIDERTGKMYYLDEEVNIHLMSKLDTSK